MQDEGLAVGQPLGIWTSAADLFVDERPATLVRNEVLAEGARTLTVRDETNGNLRVFVKRAERDEFHERGVRPRLRSVITLEPRDVVVMHERSRVQSCDLCGELDVFGARGNGRSRCGRCVNARDCVPRTLRDAPVGADLARALLRYELAIEDSPMLRRALDELDGLRPWRVFSEPFVPHRLDARDLLVRAMWEGELVHGATVGTFVVGYDDIRERDSDAVVAERVA